MKRIISRLLALAAIIMPFFIFSYASADILGQSEIFNTNETFDNFDRTSVSATLRYVGSNAYFYVDDKFWNSLNFVGKNRVSDGIANLSNEFDYNIYPKETSFWGQEPRPGIDGDNRMVILLEELKQGNGGYFSTANGFSKSVDPESNEREMVVISADAVAGQYAKIFLTHEFQHLISFNQKELLRKTSDDVWLNELRSEYSVTQTGYNDFFTTSNLERRAKTFFENPSDSLVEWPNAGLDYALVALFAEYVVDQYGVNFLRETLQTDIAGISSINSVLANRGNGDTFIEVFAGWMAANYINDKSANSKFGYSHSGLKNFKANPQRINILSGSELTVFDYSLKPWQIYGHKFLIGDSLSGNKAIKLSPAYNSKFAYADNLGRLSVISKDFYVTDPGGPQYFFIFPVNDKKISDFDKNEDASVLTLSVAFIEKTLGMNFGSALKDGSLIKKARESEVYVVEGKYKRYLRPEIIALYGHLVGITPLEVGEAAFHSYTTANYVRYVNEERVYAIWPDGTKHWLNITPQQWDASGRDWNAIFVVNDLELNAYGTGLDIIR